MDYFLTEESAEIEALAKLADAIEVAGCTDDGDSTERCDDERADFYSVYFHFTPTDQQDANQMQGALCIADRNTVAEARRYAGELANAYSLPVNDFAGEY